FLYRSPMEEAISTYSDYLQMCQEQNYDMKSSQVLFPKHCNEAHDELSRYIKKCRDEQTKRAFREVYEHLAEKANLTSKKLQIVCPKQTDDLIAEGQALHHCVGTYIERVAAKKCLIVFVRRVEEPKKPYVTVEVRNGKIEQIHGDHNSDPTEEVKKFVDLWSRKVLPMALQAA
ncbi:PcfJ-like protein, partial [Gemmiger formicilis]